jgi:spermidine/putrescine transport system substrate-binding protein
VPDIDVLSRRRFLQLGGAAGAAAFLAACESAAPAPTPTAPASTGPAATVAPTAAATTDPGAFRMASWIGYIDVGDDLSYPSLDRFTEETGILVDYQEVIEDNETFFETDLQGPIEAGVPTGWDLCVLTDWMVQRLIELEWLEPIDTTGLANYPANLEGWYTSRAWDPGNRFAAPYQSEMTGLGYDRAVTGALASAGILFADTYAGRVAWLPEFRDTVGLAALSQRVDPATLSQEQYEDALGLLEDAVERGVVGGVTGSWLEDMATGDVVLAAAYSADVLTLLVPGQRGDQDFRWTLPREGGMLWTDDMVIPKGALNRHQAETFIDWYYLPANAAQIAAAVNHVCPVKGAAEAMAAIDPDLADEPLIFPTPDMLERLHEFRALDIETAEAWDQAYAAVVGL